MAAKRSILLVEDDANDVAVALRALRRADIDAQIEVARDGQEAIDLLKLEGSDGAARAAPVPSVIFLDLKMPRVDGRDVLQKIRDSEHTANVPVVVLSSSDHEDDIRSCYRMGANSFLVKHRDPHSPGAYLADAARYWLHLNRTPSGRKERPKWPLSRR